VYVGFDRSTQLGPSVNSHLLDLAEKGHSVVRGAFDAAAISRMRQIVMSNLALMSNTRPTKTSRHIAGFHRFPCFESIHAAITANGQLKAVLDSVYGERQMIALGLTDITINRSQPWHTDLLRGDYAKHLSRELCWEASERPCLKALVYLQNGASLQVVSGSHNHPIDLSDDRNAIPTTEANIEALKAAVGDIVLMDIRTIHRGATEDEMAAKNLEADAKILISTVFGDRYSKLAQAMQKGNAERMIDWDVRNSPN
jgi:hypothetical protein